MASLNIILESSESILSDPLIRKDQQMTSKKTYTKHKIWNHFHENSDKTKIVCNLCDQYYNIKFCSTITNMKWHYQKLHNKEYLEILQKHLTKNNQLNNNQKIITIQQEKNSEINDDEYITEEELEEIVATGNIITDKKWKCELFFEDAIFNIDSKQINAKKIKLIYDY